MLRIRLTRCGRRNRPFSRIVVAESTSPRDGKFVEILGTYDHLKKCEQKEKMIIDKERYSYWISKGAQPSNIIEKLVKYCNNLKKYEQKCEQKEKI